MKNQKTTKKALLSSVLSLVLCLTMLIGTTFAWFTDSVTSTGNIIKSGKLDVTMKWADGKTDPSNASWTDASEGAIFTYDKWEPGYTEVYHIKIANEGTLALKYKLNIIANGTVSELADVIDVYYADPAVAVANRTQLTEEMRIGTLAEVLANLKSVESSATGTLLEEGESTVVTLALKMQESAGNEYQDKSIGTDFSVQLLATQYNYEEDSFGNDYDADLNLDATYAWDADGLKAALKEGGLVILRDDVALTNGIAPADGTVIDLNGHTILDSSTGGRTIGVQKGAKVTIVGNGAIEKDATVASTYAMPLYVSNGTAIVEGGTFNMGSPSEKDYNILVQNTGKLVINDGTFTNTSNYSLIYAIYSSTVEINGGYFESIGAENPDLLDVEYHYSRISTITIKGGVFVNYDPAKDNEGDRVVVADGYKSVGVPQANGDVWYYVVADDETVVGSTEALASAVSEGVKTIYLADGEYELKGNQADGVTLIGSGEGVKISNLTNYAGNGNLGAIWKNVNFENVIFTEKVYTMADGAQSTFKNCTFEQGFRQGYSRGVVFEGCTFYDNSEGFAMHFEKVYTTLTVKDCTFVEGTIAFGDDGEGLATFDNCTFSGVTTRTEYFDAWASCELNDCTFAEGTEIWHEQWETGETVTLNNTTGAVVIQK